MPTSVPYCIPVIASVARQLRPGSVLDVGVGFGKYGFLFREYTDIWNMESLDEYPRERWKTTIEGIEATDRYLTPMHEYLYDRIHIGDAATIVDTLGNYDIIVMGDVLEHFDKRVGESLLDKLFAHTNKCLLLTFPAECPPKDNVLGNPYESHRSAWNRRDFARFSHVAYRMFDGYTALVALAKNRESLPLLTPSFSARRRHGWKAAASWVMVKMLGANAASRLASWVAGEKIALRA